MALFTVENLTFSYPGQTARAIDSLSLTVPEGAFLVLCGPSGCGKSTLLRQLKPALAPHGTRQGRILFRDTPLDQVDQRTLAARIGFVQQSPENQIVTDKVWHELAFGLESLGVDTPTIRRRVAEMAAFFGIEDWFYRDVSQLSGGQKQLLNLASVMAMQPDVLILDEPTSQLDPIAASDFLAVLGKINRELGTAVVLTEHRLEEAFPLATAVAVMDRGQLLCTGTPYDVGRRLKTLGHRMFLAMPAAMRVWASVETEAPCPVTVREGRDFLRSYAAEHPLVPLPREQTYPRRQPVLTVQGAWFRYEPDSPDVIKGLDLTLGRGEFLALLGGNGAGKSTTLKLLSGMKKPQRGDISVKGTLGMLPQNPQTLFVKKTVREDLFEIFSGTKTPRPQQEERVARMVALCRLEDLLDRHPYDLSGGEQQRAALAKVLLLEPEILLLDEPTKGLDAEFKQAFALILRTLLARGVSLLMVSHDVEFCARYAHRCALFFDGSVVTEASPRAFFSGNSFYTTAANRMARSLEPQAVTAEDVMAVCGGTVPAEPALPEDIPPLPEPREETPDWKPKKLPLWRKALAALSGAGALAIFLYATGVTDLSAAVGKGGLTALGWQQLRLYLVFCGLLLVLALSIGRRTKQNALNAFGTLHKKWRFLGYLTFLVPTLIMTYYSVIGGWIAKYFAVYLVSDGTQAAQDGFFTSFITSQVSPIVFMLLFLALTAWVVYRGVEKGIEKYSRYIMPVLLLLVIGIAVFSLTLSHTDDSGVTRTGLQGLAFYLKPDFTGMTLRSFLNVVLDAMSQLFFSLSVSMGIMITYGS